jgi:hypothetical protein
LSVNRRTAIIVRKTSVLLAAVIFLAGAAAVPAALIPGTYGAGNLNSDSVFAAGSLGTADGGISPEARKEDQLTELPRTFLGVARGRTENLGVFAAGGALRYYPEGLAGGGSGPPRREDASPSGAGEARGFLAPRESFSGKIITDPG